VRTPELLEPPRERVYATAPSAPAATAATKPTSDQSASIVKFRKPKGSWGVKERGKETNERSSRNIDTSDWIMASCGLLWGRSAGAVESGVQTSACGTSQCCLVNLRTICYFVLGLLGMSLRAMTGSPVFGERTNLAKIEVGVGMKV
jgi:hypothetical protein